jgi:hypothetical protein
MNADKIVIHFRMFVEGCIIIQTYFMTSEYDKVGKD